MKTRGNKINDKFVSLAKQKGTRSSHKGDINTPSGNVLIENRLVYSHKLEQQPLCPFSWATRSLLIHWPEKDIISGLAGR